MELISCLIVVLGFMVFAAITIGAVSDRFGKRDAANNYNGDDVVDSNKKTDVEIIP